ncbi:MAG: D-alanyl-D-alanine carboxypeptidase [Clostridiales bacterium]|nr:D-alanyl-D-alanine carboxypeptidase [Clostridiales bacterium]
MKKLIGALLAALCLLALLPTTADAVELPLTSRAALLMEKTTGQILFAQNEHEALEPASVTKIMTLLLTMDAIDSGALSYDDVVTVSANAAGMGGSQVFLAEGEKITVEELLKSVCVSSGNDAAVALAEKVSGVTELFVEQMNNRAKGLGMDDTHFVNCTGLTAKGHVTSAYDIALMSRELLTRHPDIRRFTTIWTDTIRDGAFGLANTNKLIRFYDGATGLKTGYTASAGYCISATAEREGMELIAVIMKGETADKRNTDAKALLNYGFSTYALVSAAPEEPLPALPVSMGQAEQVSLTLPEEGVTALVEKGRVSALERRVDLPSSLTAPVAAGQTVGTLTLLDGETEVLTVPILAAEDVPRRSWSGLFAQLLRMATFAG